MRASFRIALSVALSAITPLACKDATEESTVVPVVGPKPPTGLVKVVPEIHGPSFVLRGGRVMTAAGVIYEDGDVIVVDGKIEAVGVGLDVPEGVEVIDVKGKHVTPGIIDTHSHMGVYASPSLRAHSDGNEVVGPVTAYARARDGYWPQDPQFEWARAGGITSAQILPGSANLIGGRGFTVKLYHGMRSADDAHFPGAPDGLKMACGENPKRVYGEKGGPSTRMGNVAGYRKAFQEAAEYKLKWERYEQKLAKWTAKQAKKKKKKGGLDSPDLSDPFKRDGESNLKLNSPDLKDPKATETPAYLKETTRLKGGNGDDKDKDKDRDDDFPPEPPGRDFALETLALVIDGQILVHNHCYRADEMSLMLDLAAEFGFSIRSFHHAVEAYKIADRLAKANTGASVWADWWGFKVEAYDGVRENAALISAAGAKAIIHSDSAVGIQRLNQEAAKAMYAGRNAGLKISEDEALAWITVNPAWALGVDHLVGTLEPGKHADLVVWDRSPFSVYSKAERVWIEGSLIYDRADPEKRPRTDFTSGWREGDIEGGAK
jgi:imidazolonepropionase-like amidohydrolase